jgi:oligopeptidase B
LVYFEKDDTFNVGVGKEKSRKYILISSSSINNRVRTLPADAPEGKFKVFQNVKRT